MKSQEQKNVVLVNLSETFPKSTILGPVTSILTFLAVFSKMRLNISTLPVILSFLKIFVAQTSRTRFFSSIVEKLDISAIYKLIILIFSVNLPVISIYKFCRKEIYSSHQENFEDNIQVNFNKEHRNYQIWTLFLCLSMFHNPKYSEIYKF